MAASRRAEPGILQHLLLSEERTMLYACLVVLALVVSFTLGVRRSRSGRLLLGWRALSGLP